MFESDSESVLLHRRLSSVHNDDVRKPYDLDEVFKTYNESGKKGRMTAEESALELATFCYCGIFNQIRCADIIRDNVSVKEEK